MKHIGPHLDYASRFVEGELKKKKSHISSYLFVLLFDIF